MIRRYTFTALDWPIRWHRAWAWMEGERKDRVLTHFPILNSYLFLTSPFRQCRMRFTACHFLCYNFHYRLIILLKLNQILEVVKSRDQTVRIRVQSATTMQICSLYKRLVSKWKQNTSPILYNYQAIQATLYFGLYSVRIPRYDILCNGLKCTSSYSSSEVTFGPETGPAGRSEGSSRSRR